MHKIIRSYEDETSGMPADGKARRRMQHEDMIAARRTVQWWEPAGKEVVSLELSAEDFMEVESTVTQSNILDQEVANLMLRKPGIFFLAMLPSLASQQQQPGAGMAAEAQQANAALLMAATARFELFKLDYTKDIQAMKQFSLGVMSLRGYLSWRATEHKRAEAKKGAALVRDHMAKEWQFVVLERLEQLSTTVVADAKDRLGAVHKVLPRVLLVLDFNVAHMRDLTRLAKLASQVASILQALPDAACWAIAPDFAKQKSGEARDEEVVKLFKAFRQFGLDTSIELRTFLRPHPASENRTSELPWFMDSRLIVNDGAEPVWAKAKCVRTRRFHQESQLPRASDLLDIDTLCPNENLRCEEQQRDSFFKAAQKGPVVAKDHLSSFFEAGANWHATSATLLVDLSPNAGDMAKGYFDFLQGLGRSHDMGSFYYLGIGCGNAKSPGAVTVRFAQARMAQALALEWLNGTLPLKGADGTLTQPVTTVPEPSSDELANIVGAKEAWEGLAKLRLSACALQGSEIIIAETRAKEFIEAPHDIAEAFRGYQVMHDKTWKNFLSEYSGGVRAEGDPAEDDREKPKLPTGEAEGSDGLTEYESKAEVTGVKATVACQDPPHHPANGRSALRLLAVRGGRQDHR